MIAPKISPSASPRGTSSASLNFSSALPRFVEDVCFFSTQSYSVFMSSDPLHSGKSVGIRFAYENETTTDAVCRPQRPVVLVQRPCQTEQNSAVFDAISTHSLIVYMT